jgi:antirestriction protein ArdC
MKFTENAQQVVQNLIARFETGDISPIVEVARIKLTASETEYPALKWSFSNQVLALIQTGELDCRGFRQWQEVGRYVTKGSHAAYILGPIMVKDEEAEKKGEQNARRLVGFKSIPVFAFSNTDGETLPGIESAAQRPLPLLANVAAEWGIKVRYIESKTYNGVYNPKTQMIGLATESQKTFFHELAHAAHGKLEKLKNGQDPRQETIAEFTAQVLMQVYGLQDMTGNTWSYISSYNNEPIKAIFAALDTIEKVLNLILSTAEELTPA